MLEPLCELSVSHAVYGVHVVVSEIVSFLRFQFPFIGEVSFWCVCVHVCSTQVSVVFSCLCSCIPFLRHLPRIAGNTVRLCLTFDLSGDSAQRTVCLLLDEWRAMCRLYRLVAQFADSYNGESRLAVFQHTFLTATYRATQSSSQLVTLSVNHVQRVLRSA